MPSPSMPSSSDPLAGLTLPPGDSGPLRAMAARLSESATLATAGASHKQSAASATIGSAWIGGSAQQTGQSVQGLVWSARTFAAGAGQAAAGLLSGAAGWEDAQRMWAQAEALAASAVTEEEAHRNQAVAAALKGGQLFAAVKDDVGLDGFVSPDRARARTLAQQATDTFNRATVSAVAKLASLPGPPSAAGVMEDLKIDAAVSDVSDPSSSQRSARSWWASWAIPRRSAPVTSRLSWGP